MNSLPSPTAPVVVLDTNVVLDWLVFRNMTAAGLGHAVIRGELRWIATRAMRDEFRHVLQRGRLDAWRYDADLLWSVWDQHCFEWVAPVPSLATVAALRCSDPDDQIFIDLAVVCGARWLISRDRALLKLGSRLKAAHSVAVLALTTELERLADDPIVT